VNRTDWESLEKNWGFLFKEGPFEKAYLTAIFEDLIVK
jgi:hypothetical protein